MVWLLVTFVCIVAVSGLCACGSQQADHALAYTGGCHRPPRVPNQLPLGIDRIGQILQANRESRLMELFLFHFRLWGTTLDHVFLGRQSFGTIEPRNIEAILSTNFEDWSLGPRHKIMFPLFGHGIFTQEGSDWKRSRELLRPQFVHRHYQNLEVCRESVNRLITVLPTTGVVDLQPFLLRLTLDITTAFLFGESVRSLQSQHTSREFANAFSTAQDVIAQRMRLQDLYWLVGGKEFTNACDTVHRFADQIIEKGLSRRDPMESETRYAFLDTLAASCSSRRELRSQIINILVAGRDTTACLISWTLFMLVRHPRVMEKLQEEISVAPWEGDTLTRSDLREMSYLQNILREVLRLYPPVPVNSRTALKTTLLPTGGGPHLQAPVLIPKGATVGYSVYSMHRRPDLFGMDAEIFRPERWTEPMPLNDDVVNANWGYLPFNAGPRMCLGMDFGLTEAGYTIIRLLGEFPRMKLPSEEKQKVRVAGVERQTVTLVMSPTEGCRVQLTE